MKFYDISDDDGVTKIGELACQSAFDLNANGRETHVGTAITDGNFCLA